MKASLVGGGGGEKLKVFSNILDKKDSEFLLSLNENVWNILSYWKKKKMKNFPFFFLVLNIKILIINWLH